MELTVNQNQSCEAQINGRDYTDIKGVFLPTEKEPFWKIVFDGRIIFAAGAVLIDFREKVESKVKSPKKRIDVDNITP